MPPKTETAVADTQVVRFHIGNEEYAVNILQVKEIVRFSEPTRVPRSVPFIEGIINLRGKIIPVINLRNRFGMEPAPRTKNTRILVLEIANEEIGFIVDHVNDVIHIPGDSFLQPPDFSGNINPDYITGFARVDEQLIILVDFQKILSDPEKSMLKTTEYN